MVEPAGAVAMLWRVVGRAAEVVGHDQGRADIPGAVLRHLRSRGPRWGVGTSSSSAGDAAMHGGHPL